MHLAHGDFDVRATIEQACAGAEMQALEKGVEFVLWIADSVPRRTHGDSRRLRQVLENLVVNAVKFTVEGAVTVRAGCSMRRGQRGALHLDVVDSGIGIEQSSIERLFEPFTQADASTTRAHPGPGLGLAIARELTQLMGGTIGVESRLGYGSRFWIELPMLTSVAAGRHRSDLGNAVAPWRRAPLVLVAEDSPVNQVVAVRMLEQCGCTVEVAESGTQALAMVLDQRYDAILMDCQMPEMDGYATTAELRRREGGERHTPIIALTAHALDGARERCLESGMDDYLSKPVRSDLLLETLRRWVVLPSLYARDSARKSA